MEIFTPEKKRNAYKINYTSSFQGTIRPPISDLNIGPEGLEDIKKQLTGLIGSVQGEPRGKGESPSKPASKDDILYDMQMLGEQLYTNIIQAYKIAHHDLRKAGLYLEIGMDKDLMNFPWELMYDGTNYLCLRHFIGRFVRSKIISNTQMQNNPSTTLGTELEKLSVLLISSPVTELKDYKKLPEAKNESEAIFNTLRNMENVVVKYVKPKKATSTEVYKALKKETYDILHYCGHAHFDYLTPSNSGLVLVDKIMKTGYITNTINANENNKRPALCFINACDTTKPVVSKKQRITIKENRLNIYTLARAFLETGACLLGSSWQVEDKTASDFAEKFYFSLIKDQKSIGESILDARKTCKEKNPSDVFGWATYIYYGNPRLYFKKIA